MGSQYAIFLIRTIEKDMDSRLLKQIEISIFAVHSAKKIEY